MSDLTAQMVEAHSLTVRQQMASITVRAFTNGNRALDLNASVINRRLVGGYMWLSEEPLGFIRVGVMLEQQAQA
jgi:hypothetical protein